MSDVKDDFWNALARSPFLMVKRNDSDDHALPMTAQLDRDLGPARGGAIWFFTERNNRLAKGGPAMAQYVAKGHDLFACISGVLYPEQDPALIDRFWSPTVAAWYDGGRDDPDLLMLRMDLMDVEIWEADVGIKGLLRMVTGSKIKGREAGKHVHEAV
ncbi:pyridoxamine 5'-phosphate oxidase family protein [Sphingobium nicotianae]|uniref:Pyridoxamine 5'-phosphate oxidase family protein n=1 Tax=Sphingobium nicotianae TaxID=2782607 RepID=A0A9X1DDM1_9SPHN|nr:pyridoxamine 5'-phosphate oxidase family protein [Sphingobium nicotianae]MBT2187971.1 pyridoxamine 5'-phosphate oxidase family protein [Sphingobium nicotianae]